MITKEEVIKLANLARLDFSDDELDRITKIWEILLHLPTPLTTRLKVTQIKSGTLLLVLLRPKNSGKMKLNRHFQMKKYFQM